MNLVQIQERLKDAPVQAVMQYANGMNPMVPPYLALAELKRRESINQSAQSQQAMQQGQSPSVKEQIEQAAGLAALQQQMRQQGMQGLMAQARPQGIPEGIPQPRRQPESEGISGLPAGDFNFADGGIVAFAGPLGSYVEGKDAAEEQRRADQERAKQLARSTGMSFEEALAAIKDIATLPGRGILGALETGIIRPLRAAGLDIPYLPKETYGGDAESITPYMDALRRQRQQAIEGGYAAKEAARAAAVAQQPSGIAAALPIGAPPAERMSGALPPPGGVSGQLTLPSQGAGAMPMGAPKGAPEQSLQAPAQGLAALPGADEAQKRMLETMRAKPDITQGAEEYRKAQGLFGLAQPYGEDRMKRIQEMQEARKQELSDRDMERLMRVLGGIAGRGLQGAGPAYLQAVGDERAADAAFRKQMDELMGGVEEKRRAEAMTGMGEVLRQKQRQEELGLGAAEKIYSAQTKREDELAKAKLEHQLRMMQPNEAMILMRVIDDLRRRYPEKSEAEIYAMAQEAKAGVTPELKRQQMRAQQYEAATRMIANNPAIVPRGMTEEQWIEKYIAGALPNLAQKGVPTAGLIPQQAIDYLKKNPNLAAQFDAKYGAGASAKYLGQ